MQSTPPLPVPTKSVRFAANSHPPSPGGEVGGTAITVLTMCGEELAVVHVAHTDTVADLKSAVVAQSPEVRCAAQKFILGTQILEDDNELLYSALEAAGCSGDHEVMVTLVLQPVDPFPKLYVDPSWTMGARLTASRAEKTPKKREFEEFLADMVLPWDGTCKECDGTLVEITRDYDFATPCKNRARSNIKVSTMMWCRTCRLVFEGLHRTSM